MSMHGKVHEWKMTEEERLAYIKKHPIIPTEKPKGTGFHDITDIQFQKVKENRQKEQKRIIDSVDVNKVREMYLKGERLADIANSCNLSQSNLNRLITEQRNADPDKWPKRLNKR